jgi:hypothetical protein
MPPRTRRADIDDLLEATRSGDARTRRRAAQSMCPCHVKANDSRIWDRALAMVGDPDRTVRSIVLHMLADGSPCEREAEVVAAVERLRNDPDLKLRRQARRLLARYRAGGRINVL